MNTNKHEFIEGGVRVDTFGEIIYIPLIKSNGTEIHGADDNREKNIYDDLSKNEKYFLLYEEMFEEQYI